MTSIVIDRRKNAPGKSIPNRQRFIARSKRVIQEAAKKALEKDRSILDKSDQEIVIPADSINEPHFHFGREEGFADYVLPGNKEFVVGDIIPKDEEPPSGGGAGQGGGGEDEFGFTLTYEEFINLIFDDLELPELLKRTEKNSWLFETKRAGFTPVGIPSNLNIERTFINGLGRRIAFTSSYKEELEKKEALLQEYQTILDHSNGVDAIDLMSKIQILQVEILELKEKILRVHFIDDVDLRYNNFAKYPQPITNAVMFLLMDVSGSMGVREKLIAKKFFILLHLFLQKRYKRIDVIFVRHHHLAFECDEELFFTGRDTGGTVVSTGYQCILDIIKERYPLDDWNIFLAQASDGDNSMDDMDDTARLLIELMKMLQYFFYVEIDDDGQRQSMYGMFGIPTGVAAASESTLMPLMKFIEKHFKNSAVTSIKTEEEVLNVFRELFKKKSEEQ